MTGKIHNRKQTKHKRKNNEQNSTCGKHFSLVRKVMVHCDRPRSNCLLCWVKAVSRCRQRGGSLANFSRAPTCASEVVDSSLSSIPMSDLNRIHSCSGLVKLSSKTIHADFKREKSFLLVWVTKSSMLDWALDAGLSCTKGVWYIYDWDTGQFMLVYWEASPVFSRTSFTHHVISSCNLLVNMKDLESTFLSLSASDEAAAS